MLIRPATRADLEQARVLFDEFHAFHVRGVPSHLRVPAPEEVDAATFDRAIERLVEGEDATLLVAESDGCPVGFAEVYLDPPAASAYVVPHTTATLQSLLVTEGFRGTAVGVSSWTRPNAGPRSGRRRAEGEDVGIPGGAALLLRGARVPDALP